MCVKQRYNPFQNYIACILPYAFGFDKRFRSFITLQKYYNQLKNTLKKNPRLSEGFLTIKISMTFYFLKESCTLNECFTTG